MVVVVAVDTRRQLRQVVAADRETVEAAAANGRPI